MFPQHLPRTYMLLGPKGQSDPWCRIAPAEFYQLQTGHLCVWGCCSHQALCRRIRPVRHPAVREQSVVKGMSLPGDVL